MSKPYCYEYPRPALTVDCVVFAFAPEAEALKLLLIRRGLPPFQGRWALPGGFVRMDETVEEAARRELEEEAGLRDVFLEQLHTFSAPDRDPRERVVSVAHYALVSRAAHVPKAATDATSAGWFDLHKLPELAFDHARIVSVAKDRLKQDVRHRPIGFELLPEKFTLGALQRLYEAVLQMDLDKRNFRKKIQPMDFIVALDEHESDVAHRRARLYRFDRRRYREAVKTGFSFEV